MIIGHIVRCVLTVWLLWLVQQQVGSWALTLVLAMNALAHEATTWWIRLRPWDGTVKG